MCQEAVEPWGQEFLSWGHFLTWPCAPVHLAVHLYPSSYPLEKTGKPNCFPELYSSSPFFHFPTSFRLLFTSQHNCRALTTRRVSSLTTSRDLLLRICTRNYSAVSETMPPPLATQESCSLLFQIPPRLTLVARCKGWVSILSETQPSCSWLSASRGKQGSRCC